jgi:hypothetical protein
MPNFKRVRRLKLVKPLESKNPTGMQAVCAAIVLAVILAWLGLGALQLLDWSTL